MKIVMPSAEIIPRMEPLKKVELCARVSYKSENKITDDSAERFCRKLLELGHTSVFEHTRVVVKSTAWYNYDPYGAMYRILAADPEHLEKDLWLMNARDYLAGGKTLDELKRLPEANDYMSVRFVCDRAIANELVRHRQMSATQSSTRYINYRDGVDFVLPVPFDWTAYSEVLTNIRPASEDPRYAEWKQACAYAERSYIQMIHHGATPQEARDVLPLSTKTELIMTGMYQHPITLHNQLVVIG